MSNNFLKVVHSTAFGGGRSIVLARECRPTTRLHVTRPVAAFSFAEDEANMYGIDDDNGLNHEIKSTFVPSAFPLNLQPSSTNGLILALLIKLYRDTSNTVPVLQDLCYAPLPEDYSASLTNALSPIFTSLLKLPSDNTFVKDNLREVAGRVRLNSISLPSSPSSPTKTISALYPPSISFINHSCTPNAFISSSTDDATLTLISHNSRSLPTDTEIFIDYMGTFRGKQAKKKDYSMKITALNVAVPSVPE
eukprot:CAMPEP_0118649212 /NCGR_PEP_ID=MMETSP0785-20121206/9580_1 /TAXON_ID=91992 /ORGANISM="Bolidomonas pacifica, Strain CCMP 1866" /LENGTH=249 /DNA_ID=CAMNT_0006541479 /DNA_START=140 /DNA_END=890 /DNA_ORIENTATION=-